MMIGSCVCKCLSSVKHYVTKASIFHELYYLKNHYYPYGPYPSSLVFLRCISNIPDQKDSFAVSYLKNSLGISQETAIKLTTSSRCLHFENPEKPDLVLKFFENHGFSKTQVSSIIKTFPALLLSNPENTLLPKFEFFYSKGIKIPDLAKLISSNPNIFGRSLQNSIIPNYNYFKNFLGSNEKFFIFVKRGGRWSWTRSCISYAEPNIAILREYGVPESNIKYLVSREPGALMISCDKFRDTAEEVKTLGFDPLKLQFVVAIYAKRGMQKSTWEKKVNAYKEWGWSDKEVLLAFARHPCCMMYSPERIKTTVDFFINRMGWKSSIVSRCPVLLSYSLEKRIIPRCSFFEVLLSKGLLSINHYEVPILNVCWKTTIMLSSHVLLCVLLKSHFILFFSIALNFLFFYRKHRKAR